MAFVRFSHNMLYYIVLANQFIPVRFYNNFKLLLACKPAAAVVFLQVSPMGTEGNPRNRIPMIVLGLSTLLLLVATGSAALVRALRRAPDGYEDMDGFHLGIVQGLGGAAVEMSASIKDEGGAGRAA